MSDHKYGCLMAVIPANLSRQLNNWIHRSIDPDHLAPEGYTDEPHVTVKHGFVDGSPEQAESLVELLSDSGPFSITIDGISFFKGNEDGDVLKLDISSETLHKLNSLVSRAFKCRDKYPDYKPHLTLAYLDPKFSKQYESLKCPCAGLDITIGELVYSAPDKTRTRISLMSNVGDRGSKSDKASRDLEESFGEIHDAPNPHAAGRQRARYERERDRKLEDIELAQMGLERAGDELRYFYGHRNSKAVPQFQSPPAPRDMKDRMDATNAARQKVRDEADAQRRQQYERFSNYTDQVEELLSDEKSADQPWMYEELDKVDQVLDRETDDADNEYRFMPGDYREARDKRDARMAQIEKARQQYHQGGTKAINPHTGKPDKVGEILWDNFSNKFEDWSANPTPENNEASVQAHRLVQEHRKKERDYLNNRDQKYLIRPSPFIGRKRLVPPCIKSNSHHDINAMLSHIRDTGDHDALLPLSDAFEEQGHQDKAEAARKLHRHGYLRGAEFHHDEANWHDTPENRKRSAYEYLSGHPLSDGSFASGWESAYGGGHDPHTSGYHHVSTNVSGKRTYISGKDENGEPYGVDFTSHDDISEQMNPRVYHHAEGFNRHMDEQEQNQKSIRSGSIDSKAARGRRMTRGEAGMRGRLDQPVTEQDMQRESSAPRDSEGRVDVNSPIGNLVSSRHDEPRRERDLRTYETDFLGALDRSQKRDIRASQIRRMMQGTYDPEEDPRLQEPEQKAFPSMDPNPLPNKPAPVQPRHDYHFMFGEGNNEDLDEEDLEDRGEYDGGSYSIPHIHKTDADIEAHRLTETEGWPYVEVRDLGVSRRHRDEQEEEQNQKALYRNRVKALRKLYGSKTMSSVNVNLGGALVAPPAQGRIAKLKRGSKSAKLDELTSVEDQIGRHIARRLGERQDDAQQYVNENASGEHYASGTLLGSTEDSPVLHRYSQSKVPDYLTSQKIDHHATHHLNQLKEKRKQEGQKALGRRGRKAITLPRIAPSPFARQKATGPEEWGNEIRDVHHYNIPDELTDEPRTRERRGGRFLEKGKIEGAYRSQQSHSRHQQYLDNEALADSPVSVDYQLPLEVEYRMEHRRGTKATQSGPETFRREWRQGKRPEREYHERPVHNEQGEEVGIAYTHTEKGKSPESYRETIRQNS